MQARGLHHSSTEILVVQASRLHISCVGLNTTMSEGVSANDGRWRHRDLHFLEENPDEIGEPLLRSFLMGAAVPRYWACRRVGGVLCVHRSSLGRNKIV